MFFTNNGTALHYRMFRTYVNLFQAGHKLYYRHMVVKLRINIEIFILHKCFHYFVHLLYIFKYNCG